MLRRLAFLAAFVVASAALIASAQTNTYLIFSSQALCQARAQAQCAALNCDGVQTRYWWSCVGPLSAGLVGPNAVTSGSYALTIQPGKESEFEAVFTDKSSTPSNCEGAIVHACGDCPLRQFGNRSP